MTFGEVPAAVGLDTVTTPLASVATDLVEAPYPAFWTAVSFWFITMPMMMIAAITTIATAPMISWVRLLLFDVRAWATDFREIDCCLPLGGFEAADFEELPPEAPLFWGPVGLRPLLPCATVLSSSPCAHPCPALRHRRATSAGSHPLCRDEGYSTVSS